MTWRMTEDTYKDGVDSNSGLCLACGEVDNDGAYEPDARGRPCYACGKRAVCGFEWALIGGAVEFVAETLPDNKATEGAPQ